MIAKRNRPAFGWRIYGMGIVALGMVCLLLGDFHPGQPVPKDFPGRTALAYAAAAFMLPIRMAAFRSRPVSRSCAAPRPPDSSA